MMQRQGPQTGPKASAPSTNAVSTGRKRLLPSESIHPNHSYFGRNPVTTGIVLQLLSTSSRMVPNTCSVPSGVSLVPLGSAATVFVQNRADKGQASADRGLAFLILTGKEVNRQISGFFGGVFFSSSVFIVGLFVNKRR
jgi:hypothetical protein